MRDHAIAPTAQRLAEENNVDWRMLTGSGEGGNVVERDVLGYLARVMSGEEATNPTPEPLPEGLSAWPEEPERRQGTGRGTARGTSRATDRSTDRNTNHSTDRSENQPSENSGSGAAQDASPFTAPPLVTVKPVPDAEAHTPWTVEKPAATVKGPVEFAQGDAETAFNTPQPTPEVISETTPQTDAFSVQPGEARREVPTPATPATEDSPTHQATLAELETLRERVEELEEEKTRHVKELHQLSRMQETIALQKTEGAKLGALQSEVRDLKAQLAAAQRAGERVEALAAHNRDLEARLVRARTFKSKAKAEFERIIQDNMMLEHELADFKRARRGLFRKGR